MSKLVHWIEETLGLPAYIQGNILSTLILLTLLWVLRLLLLRLVNRKNINSHKHYQWKKTSNYLITGLGTIFLINIWFNGFQTFATFLGLFAVGLVVALREPIANMFGWLFLIWKRPFKVGDRIKIGEHTGDVIDITFYNFTVNELGHWVDSEQPTGRVVHIPNNQVFSQPLINYNYGFAFLWHEVKVYVTFESNWKEAKNILKEIALKRTIELNEAAEHLVRLEAQRHLIFYNDLKPKVFTKVKEHGIQLTMRYLSNMNGRRESEELAWEEILDRFLSSPDIRFAYPTTRFYQSPADRGGEVPPQVVE